MLIALLYKMMKGIIFLTALFVACFAKNTFERWVTWVLNLHFIQKIDNLLTFMLF